jgi:WD40 repeat protein
MTWRVMSTRLYLAAGYANGGVAVFDWASGGTCVWSELLHEGECRSVDFCPAGKLLLSGGFDGACRVTSVGPGRYCPPRHHHHHAFRSLNC